MTHNLPDFYIRIIILSVRIDSTESKKLPQIASLKIAIQSLTQLRFFKLNVFAVVVLETLFTEIVIGHIHRVVALAHNRSG